MATGTETATSSTLYFGPWYRKSPFFEATLRYGCKAYDIYNHMYLPGYYDDPITEYWHLLNHVTVWDVAVGKEKARFTAPRPRNEPESFAVSRLRLASKRSSAARISPS